MTLRTRQRRGEVVGELVSEAAVCPACRSALAWRPGEAGCLECGEVYVVDDGVPVLVAGDSEHSAAQALWFDEDVDERLEIERPYGMPKLYGWLLGEKFRRAVRGLELRGASALVVCGGSGMDAEFIAREGARVVSTDVSLGAVKRARERAERHRFGVDVAVADVSRLPFGDRSFDVVYVHDGLHHLEDPIAGLREMARVARLAVCVSEPAQAAATALAVRAGIALDREEAGNLVARLTLDGVAHELESLGFRVAHASRYAMFYRHDPGFAMRKLSARSLYPLAKLGWRVGNLVIGRGGNKLAFQARRKESV